MVIDSNERCILSGQFFSVGCGSLSEVKGVDGFGCNLS